MEAFQLLSRGGVQFNKNKFKNEIKIFNKSKASSADMQDITEATLPQELDFFKYTQGGPPKRKSEGLFDDKAAKKRRLDGDGDSENGEGDRPLPRHRVNVKGSDIPEHTDTFDSINQRYRISPHIMANLAKNNFRYPTGIQSHAVPILLEGRDLAAISPTGTGKTLSYVLPILASLGVPHSSHENSGSGARALILAPTRELAHQIHNECLRLGEGRKWRLVLFSKASANTMADKNARDKVDIIISTPLRLVASLQAEQLDLSNVRHLILDEADRMLDAEFLPQIEEVVAACTHPRIQKAVFSATLPSHAEKMALDMLRNPIRLVVGLKDTPLPLISQSLTYVADDHSKLPSLLAYLTQPYNPPILIFTSTQPRASSLCEELVLNEIQNVDCLHAGLTKKEREDAVSRMRRGETWVMITTEVMARGMDFKGIREVINYDFPTSVQSYIHRIGRTGRAGREGKAVTYFTNDDAPYLKSIANVLLQSGSTVPDWILKLPKPSKMKRRQMGKVKRPDTINAARKIGRNEALKKRDMINGSKRRIAKQEKEESTNISGNNLSSYLDQ